MNTPIRKLYSTALAAFALLLAIALFANIANAATPSIHWVSYSNGIFKTAKAQHKQIFIFGKADWCHWCQQMKSEVFTDPNIITLINKKYVPVIVDIDNDPTVANDYQINSTPTFIILNADKSVANTLYGYMPASELEQSLR